MRILLVIFLSSLPAIGQLASVSFTWDSQANIEAYRIWDVVGTNYNLIGRTATNFFTVTNWNLTQPRSITVTASNMLGESPKAPALNVPQAPVVPTGIKPVPLSLVVPLPGEIQFSPDLANWQTRLRIAPESTGFVAVTYSTPPTEPMMFIRPKPQPVPLPLP